MGACASAEATAPALVPKDETIKGGKGFQLKPYRDVQPEEARLLLSTACPPARFSPATFLAYSPSGCASITGAAALGAATGRYQGPESAPARRELCRRSIKPKRPRQETVRAGRRFSFQEADYMEVQESLVRHGSPAAQPCSCPVTPAGLAARADGAGQREGKVRKVAGLQPQRARAAHRRLAEGR